MPDLDAKATRHFLELDTAIGIVRLERLEHGANFVGRRLLARIEYLDQLRDRQRSAGRKERCFDHVLEVSLLHSSVSTQ